MKKTVIFISLTAAVLIVLSLGLSWAKQNPAPKNQNEQAITARSSERGSGYENRSGNVARQRRQINTNCPYNTNKTYRYNHKANGRSRGYGPGDGTGNGGRGPRDGTGYGPGYCRGF